MAGSRWMAKVALAAVGVLGLAGCSGSSSGGGPSTSAAVTASSGVQSASPAATTPTASATTGATQQAGGATGCAVMTAAEVSGVIGASVGAAPQIKTGTLPGVSAHTGCEWHQGTVSAAYDENTYIGGPKPSDRITAGYALVKSHGVAATQVTIDGSAGYEADAGLLQLVTFAKGGAVVVVSVGNGKPGSGVALANLLAGRL